MLSCECFFFLFFWQACREATDAAASVRNFLAVPRLAVTYCELFHSQCPPAAFRATNSTILSAQLHQFHSFWTEACGASYVCSKCNIFLHYWTKRNPTELATSLEIRKKKNALTLELQAADQDNLLQILILLCFKKVFILIKQCDLCCKTCSPVSFFF